MMKKLLLIVGLFFAGISAASAQCSGQSPSGYVCGNSGASQGVPSFNTITSMLDRALGSTQGLTLNRGASNWSATAALVLGLNGGTGGSVVLNGSTSGSATIQVPAAAGTNTLFQLPNTNGTNNQVLTTDGAGHLTWVSLTGTGTVTSVGLSMPAIFTVTGSPVTTSGTLTATLANETANTVWAGPATGAAAAPTFRALVNADIPTPTLAALGGVQANSPVTHQWINAINTSGIPQLSQPAFSDISGSLAPTQCPASGLATLGCVNAINATSSQWLRSLSTSGVFSASQPNFTDISGNATLAQLPGIGNNTIIANNSGGTATPLALSASQVLDMIGGTQGSVLYRGASTWTALTPGTSGQVLSSGGPAANPSWATISGTGTVTSISAGTGITLTPSPITTTGSVALSAISNGTVLANISGSSAAPTGTTPSGVLDVIGSTQGSLLTRGVSTWSALTPGSSGQFLQTNGAGSTPAWASAVSSFNSLTGAVTSNIVVQKFTASGTYTPTSGMLHAIIECVAPGGGGGGALSASASSEYTGAGGGSGGYSFRRVAASDIVGTATITLGTAGAGGVSNANGGAGGNVSVVSNAVTLCSASGGGGGQFSSVAQLGNGGAGGAAGTGDVSSSGSPGVGGFYSTAAPPFGTSGAGGSGPFGGGAVGVFAVGAATNGNAAGGFGAGGSGASVSQVSSNATGGAGSGGIVVITEFINL